MRTRAIAGCALVVVMLTFAACSSSSSTSASPSTSPKIAISVGSADFTEARVLGELYAQALEAKGYSLTRKLGLGERPVYIKALKDGQIDIVPEYTGNLLRYVTGKQDAPATSSATYAALAAPLKTIKLAALRQSPAEDKDGVVVTKATAVRLHLTKVSDLSSHASSMTFAGPPACPTNPACLKGLQSVYGLHFKKFQSLQAGTITVNALKGGAVDAANIFSTDGQIVVNGFVVLDDDKHIAGAQNVVPVIRQATLDSDPGIAAVLNAISARITTAALTDLNKQVDVDKKDPGAVAAAWLHKYGYA